MALKPIDPGDSASKAEKAAYQQAQEQARSQPHLWANGPEHRMPVQSSDDPGNKSARSDGRK